MVASQYGRWSLIQRGGWHGLACLLFGVLEAATFEQLRHVGARFDVIEGAHSGPRYLSERAGLPARRGRAHLQNTLPPSFQSDLITQGEGRRAWARYGTTGGRKIPLRCGGRQARLGNGGLGHS